MLFGKPSNNIHIAVLLDGGYSTSTGMGRTTLMFCNALLNANENLTIVLASKLDRAEARALIDPTLQSRIDFCDLIWTKEVDNSGIPWVQPQNIMGRDFLSCDVWVLWNLPTQGVVAPIRPFIVFCADILTRIVPGAYSASGVDSSEAWSAFNYSLLSYRNASIVYCTTPRTLEDVVGFAGVPRSRVWLAPQFATTVSADAGDSQSPVPFKSYFLWTSNDTPHKNHLRAFEILDRYYSEFVGEALPVVITGPGTRFFNPEHEASSHVYHLKVREFISKRPNIIKNIYFAETLNRPEFVATLKNCSFLWHNVIYDNGTASVLEAAEYGIKSLVSDYPQTRYFDDKYKINSTFFSPFNVDEGLDFLIKTTMHARDNRINHVIIDYSSENRKFYLWVDSLIKSLNVFKSNLVAEGSARDITFNASAEFKLIADQASKIWHPVKRYLFDFPWSDVPVVCLIIRETRLGAIERLIDAFEVALRQKYLNFKLLILLPDDGQSLEYLKRIVSARVLVFDFIYAGPITDSVCCTTARSLAQTIFSIEAGWDMEDDKLVVLDDHAEIAEIAEDIVSRIPRGNWERDAGSYPPPPACDPKAPQCVAANPLFVPSIRLPPFEIDFQKDHHEDFLTAGFFGSDDGFRWVQQSATAMLAWREIPSTLLSRARHEIAGLFFKAKKTRVFFIEMYVEDLAFETCGDCVALRLAVNGREAGERHLSRGKNFLEFELQDNQICDDRLNKIDFVTDFEYKAGGRESLDQRMIAWKAIKFGFSRGKVNMHRR